MACYVQECFIVSSFQTGSQRQRVKSADAVVKAVGPETPLRTCDVSVGSVARNVEECVTRVRACARARVRACARARLRHLRAPFAARISLPRVSERALALASSLSHVPVHGKHTSPRTAQLAPKDLAYRAIGLLGACGISQTASALQRPQRFQDGNIPD
eukprot:2701139-Pleurochrysis_carterae.AAC.2